MIYDLRERKIGVVLQRLIVHDALQATLTTLIADIVGSRTYATRASGLVVDHVAFWSGVLIVRWRHDFLECLKKRTSGAGNMEIWPTLDAGCEFVEDV